MADFFDRRTLVLGAGGSIAAYKLPLLASLLVKRGAAVHPVLTAGAAHFVTPEALTAVTKRRVWSGTFDPAPPDMIPHIDLAKAADLILIAPASANLIARLAHGLADDLLSDIVLAATCPRFIVPAMNVHMLENPATQDNLARLRARGWQVMDAAVGLLACGDVGKGKMPEPEAILAWVEARWARALAAADAAHAPAPPEQASVAAPASGTASASETAPAPRGDLRGERILVTAGPTREAIDPVRFISNRSSGKMGYALAEAARDRGAEVCLISGPVALPAPEGLRLIRVESAAEMAAAVAAEWPRSSCLVMAAAVADYTPAEYSAQKIKKTQAWAGGASPALPLRRTEDILAAAARAKREGQLLCGFAMETEALLENARAKLEAKSLDLICANRLTEEGAGFAHDTNVLTLIDRESEQALPLLSKRAAAERVLDRIAALRAQQSAAERGEEGEQ